MSGRRIAILICALALSLPVAASAFELYLTSDLVDARSSRTFGDILVSPQSSEPSIAALLRERLPPLDRYPALLPLDAVKSAIAPLAASPFVLVGGRIAYLPKDVAGNDAAAFYKQLLSFLGKRIDDPSLRIEVQALPGADLDGAAAGSLSFRLPTSSSSPAALASVQYVQYQLPGDDGYRTVPLSVSVFGPARVAKRTIAAGATFTRDDTTAAEVDLATLSGSPAQLPNGSYVAGVALAAGSPILEGSIHRLLAVSAGKSVTVTFARGAVQVSVPGIAFGSGAVGDRIAVALSSSGSRYLGRVVSPTQVVVQDD